MVRTFLKYKIIKEKKTSIPTPISNASLSMPFSVLWGTFFNWSLSVSSEKTKTVLVFGGQPEAKSVFYKNLRQCRTNKLSTPADKNASKQAHRDLLSYQK